MYNIRKIKEINLTYKRISEKILSRLDEFKRNYYLFDEKNIFSELAFCILTPQSKAVSCWTAVEELRNQGLLFSENRKIKAGILRGKVRFHNIKADNLCRAGNFFLNSLKYNLNDSLEQKDIKEVRKYLVENIRGFGFKESSHFLRNIGFGEEIAILDRHILKKLYEFEVIKKIPKTISEKKYLEIESKMKTFSEKISIPISHLDLLLWYMATGEIFK